MIGLKRDIELDAETDVIQFHDRMRAKGDCFYGVAVVPPRGKEMEVRRCLEEILGLYGLAANFVVFGEHLVFSGEYPEEVMAKIEKYLTSIENETPVLPAIRQGGYFEMLAYKWLDGIVERPKFRKSP